MFRKLSNAQKDEEFGFPLEDGIYRKEWSAWRYGVIVLLIFPVICIPILFGLVANAKHETKNYYQNAAVSSFTSSAAIPSGKVVSLAADGTVQAGAGTSIYKNIVDVTLTCPDFLSMDSMFGNTYLMSYATEVTKKASLQVVTVSSATPNVGTIADTMTTDYTIAELITLDADTGLFVGITQDVDDDLATSYVVAGAVNKATSKISTLTQSIVYGGNYSVTPAIVRLSATSFAIGYYNDTQISTRYGKVDPTTLAITLYDAATIWDDRTSSYDFTLVGMTSTSFIMLCHNSTTKVEPFYGYGLLQATLVTVDTTTGTTVTSEPVSLPDSTPIFSLAATRLDDTTAVVVYADYAQNYGIKAQVVELENVVDANAKSIVFGSSWLLTSGQASAVVNGGMLDLDVVTVSEGDSKFLVAYSDVSNRGAMTATMGQLTSAGEVVRASADFLLNTGSAEVDNIYTWAALAAGTTAALASRTAILTSVTNKDCSITPMTKFSMMEVHPAPLGVTSSASSSSGAALNVVLSGTVSGWDSSLSLGVVYYGNSMGSLIEGDAYYGRQGSEDFSYIYDTKSDTIVAQDGQVGFASAKDTLFVRT